MEFNSGFKGLKYVASHMANLERRRIHTYVCNFYPIDIDEKWIINKACVNFRSTNTSHISCIIWIADRLYSGETWFKSQSGYSL